MSGKSTGESRGPTFRELSASVSTTEVRAWALGRGMGVSRTGGLPRFVYDEFLASRTESPPPASGETPAGA